MLILTAIICLLIILLCSFVLFVVFVIGLWKLFQKAGEEGWKALIPIYNVIVLCRIVGISPYWVLIVFIAGLFGVVPVIGTLISLVTSIYLGVILSISTAKSFGKDETYAIGLFIIPPIFYMILGIGNSSYKGPKPVNDPVFDWLMNLFDNSNSTNQKNTSYKKSTMKDKNSDKNAVKDADVIEESIEIKKN